MSYIGINIRWRKKWLCPSTICLPKKSHWWTICLCLEIWVFQVFVLQFPNISILYKTNKVKFGAIFTSISIENTELLKFHERTQKVESRLTEWFFVKVGCILLCALKLWLLVLIGLLSNANIIDDFKTNLKKTENQTGDI